MRRTEIAAALRAQRKLLFAISTAVCDIDERVGPVQQWREHAQVMMAANRQLFATIEELRAQSLALRQHIAHLNKVIATLWSGKCPSQDVGQR